MIDALQFAPPVVGAVFGFALKWAYDYYTQRHRFKKELADNNYINVEGEWYSAWQTSVDGVEVDNSEHLKIEQKGQTLRVSNTEKAPENPKGGYLWSAQLQFFQGRNVMGWYFPQKGENNNSRGILYMTYLSQRQLFIGKWVGTAYDGELVCGYGVFAKDRSIAKEELRRFKTRHPQDLRLIYSAGID